MTHEEAALCLERGCPHNPWTEDVCGECAKEILTVLQEGRGERPACKLCASKDHTTQQHIDMQEWVNEV